MQSKPTSKKIAKKTAKKPTMPVAKKATKKIAKKTTKKTAARVAKKTPGESPVIAPEDQPPSAVTIKKGNRPILVPVDFSAHSRAALEHAALLSQCLRAPIAVLHVVHDPGDAPGYYQVKGRKKQLRRLEDVAEEMLDGFMDKAAKRHPHSDAVKHAERLLVTGLPVNRILEVAKKLKPSVVVMGSAGRTGLSRMLLGSKAEQVVRMCPYTITIVKLPDAKR